MRRGPARSDASSGRGESGAPRRDHRKSEYKAYVRDSTTTAPSKVGTAVTAPARILHRQDTGDGGRAGHLPESGALGQQDSMSGRHSVAISVVGGDGYGVEIDGPARAAKLRIRSSSLLGSEGSDVLEVSTGRRAPSSGRSSREAIRLRSHERLSSRRDRWLLLRTAGVAHPPLLACGVGPAEPLAPPRPLRHHRFRSLPPQAAAESSRCRNHLRPQLDSPGLDAQNRPLPIANMICSKRSR